jgi:hypothetical protein
LALCFLVIIKRTFAVTGAHSIFVTLVILSSFAFLLASLSKPAITLDALACGAICLCIIQAISMAIASS